MQDSAQDVATLAGGCFWCLEAVFLQLSGVEKVVSGYMGGQVEQPSYKQICTGTTGHAEVVQVYFNPVRITYGDLLAVFFAIHDPTTLNRQGNDVGTQYRSAIFFHTPEQERQARMAIASLTADRVYPDAPVTEVVPAETFWPAEDYHQGYFDANPRQPYCEAVVAPKVRKVVEKFDRLLKS
ncbi:peptide-methionine (S)-S-oxide reductase MsrA [Chitinimonas arctica]|uniref:Peptide methionine sulfoxide reductase MsrA n=1 Tax=Chitinimonas arctica TaxID=2594795 RepID=A0A516SKU3_9NEIS|nr:peptide-methionine (S)-S-oxide reductase MsrA [Chitinimonas arctica]QDQ28781.1 peptide-methionine (S)-S-oxide reductase MsrA [Chitinimonas arctica]